VSLLGVSAGGSMSTLVCAIQDENSEGAYQNVRTRTFLDRHNFGYLLKRKSEIYVATYQARLIFDLKLPNWQVAFRDLNYDCRVRHNASIGAACSVLNAVERQ